MTMTVAFIRVLTAPRVALYVLTELTMVVAAPALIAALPLKATVAILAGSLPYIVGGVVYTLRRPAPFPSVFGYHDVLHLLVIAGSVDFGADIWYWVLPLAVH
jgi:hemolysin III